MTGSCKVHHWEVETSILSISLGNLVTESSLLDLANTRSVKDLDIRESRQPKKHQSIFFVPSHVHAYIWTNNFSIDRQINKTSSYKLRCRFIITRILEDEACALKYN